MHLHIYDILHLHYHYRFGTNTLFITITAFNIYNSGTVAVSEKVSITKKQVLHKYLYIISQMKLQIKSEQFDSDVEPLFHEFFEILHIPLEDIGQ